MEIVKKKRKIFVSNLYYNGVQHYVVCYEKFEKNFENAIGIYCTLRDDFPEDAKNLLLDKLCSANVELESVGSSKKFYSYMIKKLQKNRFKN